MPTVMIGGALGVFAYVVGRVDYSKYLRFPYIPGAGELMIICAAIGGAGLGLLWVKAYPARGVIGGGGALALGGGLGTIAGGVRRGCGGVSTGGGVVV